MNNRYHDMGLHERSNLTESRFNRSRSPLHPNHTSDEISAVKADIRRVKSRKVISRELLLVRFRSCD
jgi:hypothetical protein